MGVHVVALCTASASNMVAMPAIVDGKTPGFLESFHFTLGLFSTFWGYNCQAHTLNLLLSEYAVRDKGRAKAMDDVTTGPR